MAATQYDDNARPVRSRLIMTFRALFCAASLLSAIPALAFADSAEFHIAPEPLSKALKAFAEQANMEILYKYSEVSGVAGNPVVGKLDKHDALARLLKNTGLTAVYSSETAATIRPVRVTPASPSPSPSKARAGADSKEGKTSSSAGFRVAQGASEKAAGAARVGGEASATASAVPTALQEVIVTAQKRSERLQDVPVPVTAISAGALLDNNLLRLQDYYTLAPGLNVTTDDFGTPQVTIRGLTTGAYTNPTVGIVVDDVPYGSSSALAYGQQAPDFDPSDLQRLEVLRGPQGTLYGANSMGGLLKYVTVDPSLSALSGRLEAGGSAVHNGVNIGFQARGSINLPLSDTVAIRASGFTRKDPGYIDNVETGQRGVNAEKVDGGRLSALWQPTPELSMKVSALVQHTAIDGSPSIDIGPGLGDLQQSDVRNTGWYKSTLQAYSLTVTDHVGILDLTAVSGYNITRISESFDYTSTFGPFTQFGIPGTGFNGFGVQGTPLINYQTVRKFTQEVRLSAPMGTYIEWLLGAFYDREDSPGTADLLAAEPTTGRIVGTWSHGELPSTYLEYAAFADLTFHLTDRFDVQIGGRESQNRQSSGPIVDTGVYDIVFLGMPSPIVFPEKRSKDDSFTYLLTPRFRFSSDLMLYARLASGYRPGGTNSSLSTVVLPATYSPDRTYNYEIGVKGAALDHKLSFDGSVYYIDWRQIQLQLFDPNSGLGYVANGSRAKSEGVELSVEARPTEGLSLSSWISWDDAVLTRNFPPSSLAYGIAGDRLPYSSRFSGNISIEEDFPIGSRLSGFVGAAVSYVGAREGIFVAAPPRQSFPAYARTDLHGGVDFGSWTVSAFVNNVADKRAQLNGGIGTFNPAAFQYIQPRIAGLTITWKF